MAGMAYESGTFETALAVAAGEDFALLAELRLAYLESASRQLDLLRRSRCDANWRVAAQRLEGIAASFQDLELRTIAHDVLSSAPGDPFVLRRVGQHLDKIGGQVVL